MVAAGRQRLDKWLWFARFAKTRTLAAKLVQEGHVRVNGIRAEAAAHAIRPGDILTVAAMHATVVVRVVSCGARRGPATEARLLYEEVGPAAEAERDHAALVTDPASR